jgi:hypothetical protein
MLLTPLTEWSSADDTSFDVSLSAHGRTVTARVFVDHAGRVQDFSTEDRFANDPFTRGHPLIRGRWTTPVEGFRVEAGRPVITRGSAIWHLPGGTFEYARIAPIPGSLALNVAPGA